MNADLHFMCHALALAKRNLGQAWPNPAVGALVVADGRTLGAGWTARGGRPHAEPQALSQAGAAARGATLYVTLEPCPNCAQAIAEAGIGKVVVAVRDPNPKVDGKGIAALTRAGIEVTEGVCAAEAAALNAGFFSAVQRGRPYVGLKIATSVDGKISGGKTRWITGESARAHGHLLRSQYDAILTGSSTVLTDDPLLTCRLPGLQDRSPQRIVMDRRGRLPASAKVMPAWVFATPLDETLRELASRGITRLLVEGGAVLTTAFLQENLADCLYWFRAPVAIGASGVGISAELLANPRHRLAETLRLENDILEVFECSPES